MKYKENSVLKDEIFENLLNNRMLSNDTEIKNYEYNLELLSADFSEEDIIELCSTFEDRTCNSEIMFSAIHLLETLSSELAYEDTIIGVGNMLNSAPEWANIIVYRILNDNASVQMIKKIYNRLDKNIFDKFKLILEKIKKDDDKRFGKIIDELFASF